MYHFGFYSMYLLQYSLSVYQTSLLGMYRNKGSHFTIWSLNIFSVQFTSLILNFWERESNWHISGQVSFLI